MFVENFVAQHLHATLRPDLDSLYCWHDGQHEVDFIYRYDEDIVPIEVKAGTTFRARSFEIYLERFKPKKAIIASSKDLKKDKQVIQAPLYLAPFTSVVTN